MKNRLFLILAIFLLSMTTVTTKPRLYIIGDSTACIYPSSQYPRTGWAQQLQGFFLTDSVVIVDSALSGRSSKSFYDEGHWEKIKNVLRKGDYVIIQFSHNDEKTDDASRGTLPGSTFEKYLSIYTDDAIAKGAIPILVTPLERNSWSGAAIKSTHVTANGDYPQAIRDLAKTKKNDLIDATALTNAFFEKIGKDSTTKLFLNLAAGESPNYPNGNSDNTHLQERGAKAVSQLIVDDIIRQKLLPLSMWIKGGKTGLIPPTEFNKCINSKMSPKYHTVISIERKIDPSLCAYDFLGRMIVDNEVLNMANEKIGQVRIQTEKKLQHDH